MNPAHVALGTIAFVCGAAALAAFWHRIWRRRVWPSVVAAFCLAAAAMIGDYLANDQVNALVVPVFAALFAIAFVVAMAVEAFVWRSRQREIDA
jgi:uncharacterized membrane protein YfcA